MTRFSLEKFTLFFFQDDSQGILTIWKARSRQQGKRTLRHQRPTKMGARLLTKKGATLLTRREQDCARSVVDRRRRRRNYPTKRKTPMPKDMEALKISVKMKIFLRRAFQDKHLLHRAFQTWQLHPDDPQDKSRRTT